MAPCAEKLVSTLTRFDGAKQIYMASGESFDKFY